MHARPRNAMVVGVRGAVRGARRETTRQLKTTICSRGRRGTRNAERGTRNADAEKQSHSSETRAGRRGQAAGAREFLEILASKMV
jgi:hypothetical protein